MPWTVKVDLDEDKTNVGQVTCSFKTNAGDPTPYFVYSQRAKASAGAISAIVAAARAARDAYTTKLTNEASLVSPLQAAFDAVEP